MNGRLAGLRAHPLAARARTIDRAVDDAVRRFSRPSLDAVFYPLSSAADHSLLWLAAGAVSEATGRARPGTALRLTAVLGAESALTNGVLKSLVGRVRPAPAAGPAHGAGPIAETAAPGSGGGPLPWGLRRPVTSAFPSGHATAAFTAAVFLSRADPGPPWYALAVLVGGSRVYVRLHHASDVIGGAALGLAFGLVARRLVPPSGNAR